MKKIFNKSLVALASLGVPSLLLAETGDTTTGVGPIVSVSDFTEMWEQISTNMTQLVSSALPIVVAFVVGGLTIWGALALLRVIKQGFSAGKGR